MTSQMNDTADESGSLRIISRADEYHGLLCELEKEIEQQPVDIAEKWLDELYCNKPVRLKWYLMKANLMLRKGISPEKVKLYIENKCMPCYLYEDVAGYFQMLCKLSRLIGNELDEKRYVYQYYRMIEYFGGEQNLNTPTDLQLERLCVQVCDESCNNIDVWKKLCDLLYITNDVYLYVVACSVLKQKFEYDYGRGIQKPNLAYLIEQLKGNHSDAFIILDADNSVKATFLYYALKLLKKDVYLQSDLMSVGENDLYNIFMSGNQFEKYSHPAVNGTVLERLSCTEGDYFEDKMAYGRYGSYLSYISNIYCMGREEIISLLKKSPECRFSILIPCRSVTHTLEAAIRSCLNQTFTGNYEIVVSDNSCGENEIRRICEKFHDSRIRYLRTPRDLSLPKAFEFAYLQSKGDFVFSLGADDGIFPWALEEMDGLIQRYPDEDIFLWSEAFYKWPDLNENIYKGKGKVVFTADNGYVKGSPDVHFYNPEAILNKCFSQYNALYFLPQLYHNSGIRRRYLYNMYEKLGTLWSGFSQDICMAVLIANSEKRLCFADNVLTITGISNASIGAAYITQNEDCNGEDSIRNLTTFSIGTRIQTYVERFFPKIGLQIGELYAGILYGYMIGVVPKKILDSVDWKMLYKTASGEIMKNDPFADAKIHRMKYAAWTRESELSEWFDNEIYRPFMEPEKENETAGEEQKTEFAYVCVGSERFDIAYDEVSDIYKASNLVKIFGVNGVDEKEK